MQEQSCVSLRRADRGLENEREQQLSSQELERKTLILYKAEDERPPPQSPPYKICVSLYTTSNSFSQRIFQGIVFGSRLSKGLQELN